MTVSRRTFVATALAGTTLAVAGCSGGGNRIELDGEDALPVPVAGDPEADVTVRAFEDFGCGGCQQYSRQVYPTIESEFVQPGEIRYERRDFPIPVSQQWSWPLASAAREVQDQVGDEAFYDFEGRLYEAVQVVGYSTNVVENAAEETTSSLDVDVDVEGVLTALEEEPYRDALETDKERASDAGVDETPTITVNGKRVEDWSAENLTTEIENAL